jgi:hypothetical protein
LDDMQAALNVAARAKNGGDHQMMTWLGLAANRQPGDVSYRSDRDGVSLMLRDSNLGLRFDRATGSLQVMDFSRGTVVNDREQQQNVLKKISETITQNLARPVRYR